MRAEAAARVVIPALWRAGSPDPIVLKGPALAIWLYTGDRERTFGDLDLLVKPARIEAADGCLSALGYSRGQAGWDRISHAWRKPGETFAIDLHTSIVGADADPGIVWRELTANSVERYLLGVPCRCLDEDGLAMHVATHAAQHALDGDAKPLEDLRLALAAADADTWTAAADRARRIGAEPAFAAGLRRLPEGAAVAARLGLSEVAPIDVALRASEDPPALVLGLEQLRRTEGAAAKARFALSKVFPPAGQLRATSSLARRGGAGLVAAYGLRPFAVAAELPRALARHRSLSRAAREDRANDVDDH